MRRWRLLVASLVTLPACAAQLAALREAHRALKRGLAEPRLLNRLGRLYAQAGQEASAAVFLARAAELDPSAAGAASPGAGAAPTGPIAEDQLRALSLRLFADGQIDLGLRADLARLSSLHAREEGLALDAATGTLDGASVLLLASGLTAHAVGIARNLLSGGEVGCHAECTPPARLMHTLKEQSYGYAIAEVQAPPPSPIAPPRRILSAPRRHSSAAACARRH